MTTIIIKNKPFQVATTWNDLTRRQILDCMVIIYNQQPERISILRLIRVLANVPTIFWNRCQVHDVDEFTYLVTEFLKAGRLTSQKFTMYGKLAGPADNFNNLHMDEFIFTENYFFSFREEKRPEDLDNLCAVLFRPVKPKYNIRENADGDIRIPFNENKCLNTARRVIRKWPLEMKLAVLTWYEHCRLQLVDDFPTVFAGGGGEPAQFGLISMIRNVALTGTHGSFEKVEKLPLKMVMIELTEMMNDAEQIKKLKPGN